MSINAVARAVSKQQRDIEAARRAVDQIRYTIDDFRMAIEAFVGHPAFPNREETLSIEQLASGKWVLLRAGEVSTITLTGTAGWRFDELILSVENRSQRMAIEPNTTPLVFDEIENSPYHTAKILLEPAQLIRHLVVQRTYYTSFDYSPREAPYYYSPPAPAGTTEKPINHKVDTITMTTLYPTSSSNRIAVIRDNEAMGLGISTADDRLLHRAPQTLVGGQSAVTPNLADVLNGATQDAVTFNLMSQSDCVLHVSGTFARRRAATGFEQEVPELLSVTPWAPVALTPTPAASTDPQITRLTGKARKTGPARLMLTQGASSGQQTIRPHPRLQLVQPFQPLATAQEMTVELIGLWLLLREPPESAAQLSAEIGPWDARDETTGEPLVSASADLEAGLTGYETGPDGLIAAWIPFDEPWLLDPDDQELIHALTIREIDGPVPLVEAPLSHARLTPILSRDVARSQKLVKRDFGAGEKALLFDLGMLGETVEAVFAATGTAPVITVGPAFEDIEASLPRAAISVSSAAAIEIEELEADTST
ncbi:MAG: hypothetical protein AAF439_03795 [Pseudomonadota bacterium]